MATQTVDSIQMEETPDTRADNFYTLSHSELMDRADYISNPGHNAEATIKGPEENKTVDWKKWLTVAAAVIASIVILVLIILVITAYVDNDSAETLDQPCLNPPTGIMRLTSGVKVLAVDSDPRNLDVSGDGETVQIIALTCNGGRKFVDQKDKEWDLPDQVSFIENLYIGQAFTSASMFRTTDELDVYRSAKLGLKIGGGWLVKKILGKNKASGSWKYYSNQISQENQTVIKTYMFVGSYKAVFKSYEGLRFESSVMTSFQKLRDCPQKSEFTYEERLEFEECRNAYKDFIDFHGTHYYTQASLGGRAWSYYEVYSSYMSTHDQTQIQVAAKLSFLKFIRVEGEFSEDEESTIQDFRSHTESEVSYKGGKAEYYGSGNYSDWRDSVFSYPVSFAYELAPIYFLVDKNDPRREIMREEFENYIDERTNDTAPFEPSPEPI